MIQGLYFYFLSCDLTYWILYKTINHLIKVGDFPIKRKLSTRRTVFLKSNIEEWINSKKLDDFKNELKIIKKDSLWSLMRV